jgi:hypothetical protein
MMRRQLFKSFKPLDRNSFARYFLSDTASRQ